MDRKVAEQVWNLIELVSEKKFSDLRETTDVAFSALGIDSLKLVQLVFEIETTYSIEIPEHLLFNLETVEELILLIMHYRRVAA